MDELRVPISRDSNYKVLTSTESLRISLKMAGILKTVLCPESGIPTKDKRAEKWMRRTAKGLCFISEYKGCFWDYTAYRKYMSDRNEGLFNRAKRCLCDKTACFGAVLPLTSASSSLVLSLSIFSFQSLERSFSIQEDSKKKIRRTK